MESTTKTLSFKVLRKNPELIAPAKPTPHEFKLLSDIDDQESVRIRIPVIQFFERNPSTEGKDPAKVIRDAIAKALVFYYPLAGRLREGAAKKLVVECTGEGVMFVEADADVALRQFGDVLHPPITCLEELLHDVPGSTGVLDSPLLLFQVTRLKCGGFVLAVRLNHTMCDAAGLAQFMSAIGEFARGAVAPSVAPVWERHLLRARDPPRVTCTHPGYDDVPNTSTQGTLMSMGDLVYHSFFFGTTEFAALRRHLPPHLRGCSRFDLLTACLWRCRTIATSPGPNEEVRGMFVVNARKRLNPPLPDGYYGNAAASPVAIATAGELTKNPLHYAVELVREAKAQVTDEYIRSVVDLMVVRGRPPVMMARTFVVSDVRYAGFHQVDYGWGKPAYGGPAESGVALTVANCYIPFKNNKGEEGIVVPMCFPTNAMKVFVKELQSMLYEGGGDAETGRRTRL